MFFFKYLFLTAANPSSLGCLTNPRGQETKAADDLLGHFFDVFFLLFFVLGDLLYLWLCSK